MRLSTHIKPISYLKTNVAEVLLDLGNQDIEDIYNDIAEFDSPSSGNRVFDQRLETINNLVTMPLRGSIPKELLKI